MPSGVGYSAPMNRNVTVWAIGLCGIVLLTACQKPETQAQKYVRYKKECVEMLRLSWQDIKMNPDNPDNASQIEFQCNGEAYDRVKKEVGAIK